MLKKRLSESVAILNGSGVHKDMFGFYGCDFDVKRIEQIQINMINDIKQLNYLIDCLDKYKAEQEVEST